MEAKSYNLAKNLNGLTVRQLMAMLGEMNPEAVVVFKSNYGDRGQTQQVVGVDNCYILGTDQIKETAYSTSGLALYSKDDEPDMGHDGFGSTDEEELEETLETMVVVLE